MMPFGGFGNTSLSCHITYLLSMSCVIVLYFVSQDGTFITRVLSCTFIFLCYKVIVLCAESMYRYCHACFDEDYMIGCLLSAGRKMPLLKMWNTMNVSKR